MLTITAFKAVPPFAQGLVRDLRARWALEEAGIPYRVRLIGREDQATPAYLALQPFGQVPALEDDGLVLFESGAIVLYIAERAEILLPREKAERERAKVWVFAALNSIEPSVQGLAALDLFHANERWAKEQRPTAEAATQRRLSQLASWLGERDYLEDRFSAGDLMMATVLRILRHTDLVASEPKLAAYLARCEDRPAFRRALAAQLADFDKAA